MAKAYEYKALGFSGEDVDRISVAIDRNNNLTVKATLKDGTVKESSPIALPVGETYTLPVASSTSLGGIKSQTSGTDGTDYPVEVDVNGNAKVNVKTNKFTVAENSDGTVDLTIE